MPPAMRRRSLLLAAAALAPIFLLGAEPPGARVWVEGPVRWLMSPEELKEFKHLGSNRELLDFIEAFWRRRDPTPGDPENPVRTAFYERAAAADRLYAEPRRQGSLTDRGRALILLGPPSVLRYKQKPVPAFDPSRYRGNPAGAVRRIPVEVWGYFAADLPERLLELLSGELEEGEATLTFATEGRRTRLQEGDELLELAARALIREEPALNPEGPR